MPEGKSAKKGRRCSARQCLMCQQGSENPGPGKGQGTQTQHPRTLLAAAGLLLCLVLGAVTRVQLHPWVLALFVALKGCRLCNAAVPRGKAGHGVPQPARALEQCVPQPGPGTARGVRDDATCYFWGGRSQV